jgi:hypothetical protein
MDGEAIASVANTGCTSVGELIGRLPATIDVSMIAAETGGWQSLTCKGYGVPDGIGSEWTTESRGVVVA